MSTTRRTVGALSTVALAAVTLTMTGGAAAAAAFPTLPDNMVIFPSRDFMTVEGFEGLEGQQATVKVMRGEQLVGQTTADIDYPEAGVAFEVNHPGGACWGQGAPAGLQVTPDLKGGDVVFLTVDGVEYETAIADIEVLTESVSGNTVTVVSRVPESSPVDRLEARIVAPDLKDTAVGRRDARATADGTGDDGYTSSLVKNGTQVTATYTFQDADTAQTALEGTSRIMSWVENVGDERAGITIYEHDEVGGPGMGGCPAGPGDAAQPVPGSATFQRSQDKTQMQIRWTPAESVAGGVAVSGYQVTVVDPDGTLLGRNTAADVTTATVSGLDPAKAYTVQVRAAQGDTLSKAFTAGESTGTPAEPTDPGDTIQPVLGVPVFDPATNELTLSATDNSGAVEIYYTLDGSNANDTDLPSLGATLYTGPITLTEAVTVNFAAFDAAGNVTTGSFLQEQVTPPAEPDPLAAPGNVTATPTPGGARLTWDAVPEATDYEVTVDPAVTGMATPLLTSGARAATVNGLTDGTEYTFTVTARATDRTGTPSAPVTATPLPQPVDTLTATAELRTRDVEWRVSGTATAVTGNSVTVHQYNSVTQQAGTLIGTSNVAADGTWTVRSRGQSPLQNGTDRVIVTSTAGAQTIVTFSTRR